MARSTRWTESETIQLGKDLVGVARELRERLADRDITEAFLTECDAKIRRAEGAASGRPVLLGAQKGTTIAQADVFERANKRVVAVRAAVQRVFPKRKDLHQAFGVGADMAPTVKGALGGIDAVLGGATSYPVETATARILARDLDGLRTLREEVLASDRTQEDAKSTKKGGTVARDDRLHEVTAGIDIILAAAGLEFAEEPKILERFTGPIPSKKRKAATPTKET